MGDSNTRCIKLNNVAFTKLPTYTIEAVDPQKCKGYAKVWLRAGVNSLKRCRSPREVYQCFQLLMSKIEQIHKISPASKLMVSPVLPTGIPMLNAKSLYFNHLLTTTPKWWTPLDFNIFTYSNRLLAVRFRNYRNKAWLYFLKFLSHSTAYYLLWLSFFQYIFIFICNPSISNPGPDSSHQYKSFSSLSVFYQNIQGLIPFSNLGEDHPQLDNNKIFELHAYIYKHIPDIIVLNETWLKPSILDSEIFPLINTKYLD